MNEWMNENLQIALEDVVTWTSKKKKKEKKEKKNEASSLCILYVAKHKLSMLPFALFFSLK